VAARLPEAVYRASLFVLPLAVAFLYVVSLLAVLSPEAWDIIVYGGMVLYLVAPVGTEVVIPLVVVRLKLLGAPDYVVAIGIMSIPMVDVFAALFIAWNWDLIERVPRLGGLVRRVEEKCHAIIARRKWGEGATLTALATYVALPVQMTGGLFGSVLGRVMGIERKRVFLAVVAGSLAGAVPMGLLAVVFGDSILEVLEAPTVQNIAAVAGILITVAFVVAVLLLYRRGKAHAD
jgi:uncharacterized membrane protein